MLAGLFLFWWVILCEAVVEETAGFLRMLVVPAAGLWPANPDSGIGALFSQGQPIPKQPEAHPYDLGYEAAAAMTVRRRRSLSDLYNALRLFLPMVTSEYEWGVVDALADEIQRRGER